MEVSKITFSAILILSLLCLSVTSFPFPAGPQQPQQLQQQPQQMAQRRMSLFEMIPVYLAFRSLARDSEKAKVKAAREEEKRRSRNFFNRLRYMMTDLNTVSSYLTSPAFQQDESTSVKKTGNDTSSAV